MISIRTDLAEELRTHAMTEEASDSVGELDGVVYREEQKGDIRISTITITNENGEKKLGKKCGRYITLSYPTSSGLDYAGFTALCDALAESIGLLCGDAKSVLVCGLGNRELAADAVGVIAAENTLATHHIKMYDPDIFQSSGFSDIAVLSPSVMAKTGMEAADIARGAVENIRPELVIAVDSLAAREASRLARTIQLSDTGIAPGSGIGNRRAAFDKEYVGVPVVAIGVPTVVDTATLVHDALNGNEVNEEAMKALSGLFVSPKEIDVIAENVGKIIGYAINRAFHGGFSYEEMAMLV